MARVDDLIAHVDNPALRKDLQRAVAQLKKNRQFGLVFEEHIPETTTIYGVPTRVGSLVQRRKDLEGNALFRVVGIESGRAMLEPTDERQRPRAGKEESLPLSDLLAVKPFGEPIYPVLRSLGQIARGAADRPYHAVINGENFHALQLLVYLFEGRVDCIYIDPPYNTGSRDWKYNNRFVDTNDTWRHSKWLSFMDKRLRLAKKLLKPDGVLIVTVDENEHAHLVMLLEQLFRAHDLTSVAIVHNPRGIQGDNFSYTNEFAVFVIPKGQKLIARRPLSEKWGANLRKWGGESARNTAKNCFYPIFVAEGKVVGFGDVAADDYHPRAAVTNAGKGRVAVWPIDGSGEERKWRYARNSVEKIQDQLSVIQRNGSVQIHLTKDTGPFKTVWQDPLYDSSTYGKQILGELVDGAFDYPKSVYAVRDCLYACTAHRPDALILDFFAGSGTTLHSTLLMNADDGGSRQCILVTNNEVADKTARDLARRGFARGDEQFEREGIFQAVTRPRVEAAITGERADGKVVRGEISGFKENAEFFELGYVDPDDLDLGRRDDALLPLLWLAAGAIGPRDVMAKGAYSMPAGSRYAVLFEEKSFRAFAEQLRKRADVTHVWLITDSEVAFAEMRSRLPSHVRTSMLYRDYLRSFKLNVEQFA